MVNLTVAFVSGIAVGVIYEVLAWNISSTAAVQTIMFALLLAVLLVRVAALRKGSRTEERSTWLHGSSGMLAGRQRPACPGGDRRGGDHRGGGASSCRWC